MIAIEDKIQDLELKVEAFQSINMGLLRLLVEVGMNNHRRSVLIRLLDDWSTTLAHEAVRSSNEHGVVIQQMFISSFKEAISMKDRDIQ